MGNNGLVISPDPSSMQIEMIMNRLCSLTLVVLVGSQLVFGQASDAALKDVTEKDRLSRGTDGKLATLSAAEHAARGRVYLENRHFPESREHFQKILDNFSTDPAMSYAVFGMGRSLMWEREYAKAIPWFERASREWPETKDGRESLAFMGACNVRLGRNAEAARVYQRYTVMYPAGERIDSAYLNTIDSLREEKRYDEANEWVDKARQRFAGMPTEVNALHARLRLEINRGNWAGAEAAADAALAIGKFAGSMTSSDEINYLKAFAVERAGRREQSISILSSIPQTANSYFSGLAAERLAALGSRVQRTAQVSPKLYVDFPIQYRLEVLEYARKKRIDPRFVMAIMKQESSFRAGAKSPSAARGLLQLVYDTAIKYSKRAGYGDLQPDDLYNPHINIAIGCEYIADLKGQFSGLYEAIAASYNGGEDNAARWLSRSRPKEPAIFVSEVGFAETKAYVAKVMNNYRVYRDLYDESLVKR